MIYSLYLFLVRLMMSFSHTPEKAVPLLQGIYVPAVPPYFLRAEHKL